MKTLTLFRHAKSGWDAPGLRDFDRPLNAKGQRAARVVGEHARAEGLVFDRVAASPAARVTETLEHFYAGYGQRLNPVWERPIYLAAVETLLDLVQDTPDASERLLLAGHNPALEDLVLGLVPDCGDHARDDIEDKFPTGSIAEIAFDVERWADVAEGKGRLVRFVRPRDLDPALGPDES